MIKKKKERSKQSLSRSWRYFARFPALDVESLECLFCMSERGGHRSATNLPEPENEFKK